MEFTTQPLDSALLRKLERYTTTPLRDPEDLRAAPEDTDTRLFVRLNHLVQAEGYVLRHSLTTWHPSNLEGTVYIPHFRNTYWRTLGRTLDELPPQGTMLYCVPFFWHVEPLAHEPCKVRGWSSIAIPENNIPLAAEAVRQLQISVVVGTMDTISALRRELVRRRIESPVRVYVCVCSTDDDTDVVRDSLAAQLADGESLRIDVHLYPGFPLATESATPQRFILNDAYLFEGDERTHYCTGLSEDALPVFRRPLPFICTDPAHASVDAMTTYTLRHAH